MRLGTLLSLVFPSALVAGLLLAHCTGGMGAHDLESEGSTVGPACDPDGYAPCPDDFFVCTEDDVGGKRCEGQRPAVPDDGGWDCYEQGTTLVCRGDHMPTDDGFWECEELGDTVICRAHAYVPGEGGGEGGWDCWYEGEFRVCEARDGGESGGEGGSEGGPSGGGDEGGSFWDDWFPDGFDEDVAEDLWDLIDEIFGGREGGDRTDRDEEGCVCIPGAWRYCDEPTYCRWGIQHCAPDGLRWGRCTETAIPTECAHVDSWYSPAAEECCIRSGFCCQDMWDLDRDGNTWESLGDCTDIVCV